MIKLIDINDIITLKPMSLNTDVTKKLTFCIEEAQKYDVMPFLGDTLYILLETDYSTGSPEFSQAKYSKLFNGCDYVYGSEKYRHGGIKAMLIYYSYARHLQNSKVNPTAFGMVEKLNDHSNGIDEKTLSRLVNNATALAEAEKSKVELFLRYNYADYSEWIYANKYLTKAPSGIKITAIGGNKRKIGSSYRCGGCGRYSCICR
ncbi:MAG TPA: hypothetical protein VJ455_06370 [Ignavibacteria bacterium]|nr:hypothetical protein [Ignavibacteria bacterium]